MCFQQLMSELETERERRWKSEQATKKLVEHIKELQSKGGYLWAACGNHRNENLPRCKKRLTFQVSEQLKVVAFTLGCFLFEPENSTAS